MQYTEQQISGNLKRIRDQIDRACDESGRLPESVRFVAVTKYVAPEVARLVAEAGHLDLGENRPQVLVEKSVALADLPVRWHMIGHLQRNKIRTTIPVASLCHSVDSFRLLESISDFAGRNNLRPSCLIEFNVSGDKTKNGIPPEQAAEFFDQATAVENVEIRGLMAMSGIDSTPMEAFRQFDSLRQIRDNLAERFGNRFSLDELSMGMSGDFVEAIRAGATLLRIGSAIYS